MGLPTQYDRLVLALDDVQLEAFVRDWVGVKTSTYFEVTGFSGPGDMGRDVVGFISSKRHEGDWHNYQCKQYGTRLPTANAYREIGKILYHASQGEFTVPAAYKFVTPRGVNRNLERLIFNPTQFKSGLIQGWSQYCASEIVDGKLIPLDGKLLELVEAFNFETISRLDLSDLLSDISAKPVLFKWFGSDPGPAPKGYAPGDVADVELPYLNQLVDAYSERAGKTFTDHIEVSKFPEYGVHLASQRERFYDADAFKRFYRDNTNEDVIRDFEGEVLSGVTDVCSSKYPDALECVNAVMSQAASVQTAGPLAPHARVQVKQGVCHHFANDGKLIWRK